MLVRPDPKEFGGQRRSGLWAGLTEHGVGPLLGPWQAPEGAQSTAEISHLKTVGCNCQEKHAGGQPRRVRSTRQVPHTRVRVAVVNGVAPGAECGA